MSLATDAVALRNSITQMQLHRGHPGAGMDNVVGGKRPVMWKTWTHSRPRPHYPALPPDGFFETGVQTQFENLGAQNITHVTLWTSTGQLVTAIELDDPVAVGSDGRFEVTRIQATMTEVSSGVYSTAWTAEARDHWTILVIEAAGTIVAFNMDAGGAYPYVFCTDEPDPGQMQLDPDVFYWQWVDYPATSKMGIGLPMAKVHIEQMLRHLQGDFILTGVSQGASVCDIVYRQIVGGSMRWADRRMLGVVAFGNPRRQPGHTFPVTDLGVAPDPGGHGCDAGAALTLPPPDDRWWDFARPRDYVTCMYSSDPARFAMSLFVAETGLPRIQGMWETSYPVGIDPITKLLLQPELMDLFQEFATAEVGSFHWQEKLGEVKDQIFGGFPFVLPDLFGIAALLLDTLSHHAYFRDGWRPLYAFNGDDRDCIEIATDYINSLANPAERLWRTGTVRGKGTNGKWGVLT